MRLVKYQDLKLKYIYKSYGTTKVVEEVIELLSSYPSLEGVFFKKYIELPEVEKERLKSRLRKVIRKEFLGKEFTRAIAKDLLEGEIKIDSEILKYLKRKAYNGNLRLLLTDLQSILEDARNNRSR